jgi:two-component system, chemotaxis family, sensor kinase CheA
VVIKSLGEALGHLRGVSGGAIMGDGTVGLILDIHSLIQMAVRTWGPELAVPKRAA